MPLGVLLVMKTFKDEWFIVIKAERFSCIIMYYMSALSLHVKSTNQPYDILITP